MIQHRVPDHTIVPLLVQEQLAPMTQLGIRLAVFVDVWCRCKGPGPAEEIHCRAFAHIEKCAYITLAPTTLHVSINQKAQGGAASRTFAYVAALHRVSMFQYHLATSSLSDNMLLDCKKCRHRINR